MLSSGEGVEDITGGVNSVIMTHSVLNKDKLWEELLNVGSEPRKYNCMYSC